ncbi:hypothetical protein ACVW00_002086 [Marmoricola sp. URHA0025 HA25]
MAGSHRAPRDSKPRTRPGRSAAVTARAVVIAVVVALVPAAVLGARHLIGPGSKDAPSSRSTDLPIPPVTPSATATTPTAGPSPTGPSPTGTAAAQPHLPRVAAAAPRRVTAGGLIDSGLDSAVTTLEPASRSEVARWESRGSPGSPGTDTVYLVGEVHGTGSAFAGLPQVSAGSKVSIRTDNGTLTYTVGRASQRAVTSLEQDPLFRTHKAGRLVLVGIRYDDSGDRLDKALVVTAQLSGAKRS